MCSAPLEKGLGSGGVIPPAQSLHKTNKTFFRSKHRPKKDSLYEPAPKSYRWWCQQSSQTPLKWLWCSGCLSPKSSSSLPPRQLSLTLYLITAPTPTPLAPAAIAGITSAKSPQLTPSYLHPLYRRILPGASGIWHIQLCENHRLFFPKACNLDGWEYFPWEWQEIFLTETPSVCHIASPAFRPWELCSVSK